MAKLISMTGLLVHWKIIRPKAYLAPTNMSVCPSKYQDCENITSCYYSYLELKRVLEYQISNQYSNFHDCAIDTYGQNLDHLKVPTLPVSNLTFCFFYFFLYSYFICVLEAVGGRKAYAPRTCILLTIFNVSFHIFLYLHKLAVRRPDQNWIQI